MNPKSTLCTLFFNGYRLALSGTMGAAMGIVLTFVTYRILVSFGYRWTKPLRHGPAAWLWRSLTCVNRQPMKQPG